MYLFFLKKDNILLRIYIFLLNSELAIYASPKCDKFIRIHLTQKLKI